MSEYRVFDIHLRRYKNKSLVVPLYSPINLSNLTVDYMVSNLGMKPVAFVGARVAHPLVYSHGGRAIHPYTIYFSPEHSLLALKVAAKLSFQESLEEFPRLVDALLEWGEVVELRRVIAVDYAPPIEGGKVYFVTEDYLAEELAQLGLEPYDGVFSSEAAYLLSECMRRRIDGVLLIVESEAYRVLSGLLSRLAAGPVDRETIGKVLSAIRFDVDAVSRALSAIGRITGVTFDLESLQALSKSFEEACRKSLELLARGRASGLFV